MSLNDKKTVMVTGAAGLIGAAVVKRLLKQRYRVIACDNFSIGGWNENAQDLIWERLDISSPEISDVLTKHSVNAVVHCAAHPGGRSLKEPVDDVQVNALGSMRIFDWCARNQASVVYLSSSAIYGSDQPHAPLKETDLARPGTIYAVCKVACENYLRILGEGYGLNWTVLRLFATYGAGHKPSLHQGIVNIVLTQLRSGNRVVSKGSLERVRGLVYVDDAAEAIAQSLFNSKAKHQIFNIAHDEAVTIRRLIEAVTSTLGSNLRDINIVEEAGTVGDTFYNYADCTKAREILGFEAKFDLNKGLTEYVRHLNSHQ